MNILYLRYACEVAKTGSLNKASEKLCIAQPNLSRAIKELERELDIEIFERTSKGVQLTLDGAKLIQYGKRIIDEIDDIDDLFSEKLVEKKRFSISVPRASYIGEAFSDFSLIANTEQSVEFIYKETNALRAIKNIMEEGYHLGIIRYAANYDKYYNQMLADKQLDSEVVNEFSYVLVMNKDNPMADLDEILYSDLENYIEIAHADPYVPSVPMATVKKEELPDTIKRRIFVFERASQFEVLAKNPETFMWVSPKPKETLDRYGLVQRRCNENKKIYKDVMIYRKGYQLSDLDKRFIELLKHYTYN